MNSLNALIITLTTLALTSAAVLNQSLTNNEKNSIVTDSSNSSKLIRLKRLTAFAKPPEPVPTPKGKSRECKSNDECKPIPYTQCLAEPRDGKKRCLCRDYTVPINGICKQAYKDTRVKRAYLPPGNIKRHDKALYEKCDKDQECLEGAECRINGNATLSMPKNSKICVCLKGKKEEKGQCNGCLSTSSSLAILVTILAIIQHFTSN